MSNSINLINWDNVNLQEGMEKLKTIGRIMLTVCAIICAVSASMFVVSRTDFGLTSEGNDCRCEYWEDYHQQHPTVLSRRCEHDRDGFIESAGVKVRVTKYRNVCQK